MNRSILLLGTIIVTLFSGCATLERSSADQYLTKAVYAKSHRGRVGALRALMKISAQVPCPENIWFRVASTNETQAKGCNISMLWEMRNQYLFRVDDLHYVHFGGVPWLGGLDEGDPHMYLSLLGVKRYPSGVPHFGMLVMEPITEEEERALSLPEKSKFDEGLGEYR